MPSKFIAAQNRKKKQSEIATQTGMEETKKFLETTPKIKTEFSPEIAKTMEVAGMPVKEEQIMKKQIGEFSKEKGGFITETGKFYPTSNPDLVPSQPSLTTQIKFNKDNTIDYTPKGAETVRLSREEYNVLQGEAGNVTDKVKQIQQTQQPAQPQIDLQTQEEIAQQTQGIDLSQGMVGGAIQGAAVAVEKLSSFLPEFLRLGTKKDLDVQKAEQGFLDYSTALDKEIELYKAGLIPASQVERTFSLAEQEIIQLQSQTKNMGQLNLRFWLDKGKEIEAQVAREIAILQAKKASLGVVR